MFLNLGQRTQAQVWLDVQFSDFRMLAGMWMSTRMSMADDSAKFFQISSNDLKILTCYIYMQHEICIQMSTKKPSIGPVVLAIAL